MVTPTPKNGDENLLKKAAISFLKLDHQLAEGPAAQAAKSHCNSLQDHCKYTCKEDGTFKLAAETSCTACGGLDNPWKRK